MKQHNKSASLNLSEEIKNLLISLGYTVDQYSRIIKYVSSANIARTRFSQNFQSFHANLIQHFSHQQIIRIGSRSGGYNNLETLSKYITELQNLGLTAEHMVKVTAHNGGSINISAVMRSFTALQTLGFTTEHIVNIVGHCGGSKNIEAVRRSFNLLQELGYTTDQIVKIVAHNGASKHIDAILDEHYANLLTIDDESILSDDSWVIVTHELEELFSQKQSNETNGSTLTFSYTPIRLESPTTDSTDMDFHNLGINAKRVRPTY